ncbi:conserved hypothetical protein [Ricinus communis]|uniref:Uncharacterized protein n=1 Tax=Ricinus communis TaxID=3988 RepID=B9REJ0_RICCO|nr:conserved hypothetical protein [Ricinus communis]
MACLCRHNKDIGSKYFLRLVIYGAGCMVRLGLNYVSGGNVAATTARSVNLQPRREAPPSGPVVQVAQALP